MCLYQWVSVYEGVCIWECVYLCIYVSLCISLSVYNCVCGGGGWFASVHEFVFLYLCVYVFRCQAVLVCQSVYSYLDMSVCIGVCFAVCICASGHASVKWCACECATLFVSRWVYVGPCMDGGVVSEPTSSCFPLIIGRSSAHILTPPPASRRPCGRFPPGTALGHRASLAALD